MSAKGNCEKHGEFVLIDGCAQCVAEGKTVTIGTVFQEELKGSNTITEEGLALIEKELEGTALALRPGEDIEARGYYEESLKLLDYAKARVIATAEDTKVATDDLSIIAKLKKAMNGKKKEYLEPLKAQVDEIRATYDYLMTPILEADKVTRGKMEGYDAEQRRIRAEQEEINQKRMEAAKQEMALKGELSEPVNLVEVSPEAKRVSTDMGTAGMTAHWKYEVTDFALLPDEYKVPDTAMLNSIAKKHHDNKLVPGVKFFNEPGLSVRGR